jgi:hypothetical protein
MVDSSTIMCYLRGGEKEKLPNFPNHILWNSKKWRMLLFLSTNQQAMFAGRQYPFFSPSAMDIVQETLLNSMNKRVRCWTPWYNDYIKKFPREADGYTNENDGWLASRHIAMNGHIFSMQELIKEPKKPLFFNDLIDSSFYIPYYSWNRYGNHDYEFHIGEEVPCPCCNGRKNVNACESMRCQDCFEDWLDGNDGMPEYVYCECCDRRILRTEARNVYGNGATLCEDCYDESVAFCDKCGDDWFKNDIKYDRETEQHLCPVCRGTFRMTIPISFSFGDEEDLPF